MDLPAYVNGQNALIDKYIKKHYGDVPRMRGVRFMKLEEKVSPLNYLDERENMLIESLLRKKTNDVVYEHPSPMLIDAINQYYGLRLSSRDEKEYFLRRISRDYATDLIADVKMFNSYVGKDAIYIHTRCGDCGRSYHDSDANYRYYKADEWEKKAGDLFLSHITEFYDPTYCDHYFEAVVDDDYKKILADMEAAYAKEEQEEQ